MSTLPPEPNGEQPEQPVVPEQPVAPEPPAAAEPVIPAQPAAPAAPEAPAAPQYTAPPAGAYQQPPAGGYQQPAAGGYQQQPPAGGYQQPAAAGDPSVSNITLNYWLSVFFTWIPALIFWIIEKDKGNQRATAFHVANFNFSLLRVGTGIAAWILAMIPYVGWVLAVLLWLGMVVLFVFHIMAAAKAADNYRNGGSTDPFIFNIPLIK